MSCCRVKTPSRSGCTVSPRTHLDLVLHHGLERVRLPVARHLQTSEKTYPESATATCRSKPDAKGEASAQRLEKGDPRGGELFVSGLSPLARTTRALARTTRARHHLVEREARLLIMGCRHFLNRQLHAFWYVRPKCRHDAFALTRCREKLHHLWLRTACCTAGCFPPPAPKSIIIRFHHSMSCPRMILLLASYTDLNPPTLPAR